MDFWNRAHLHSPSTCSNFLVRARLIYPFYLPFFIARLAQLATQKTGNTRVFGSILALTIYFCFFENAPENEKRAIFMEILLVFYVFHTSPHLMIRKRLKTRCLSMTNLLITYIYWYWPWRTLSFWYCYLSTKMSSRTLASFASKQENLELLAEGKTKQIYGIKGEKVRFFCFPGWK